MSSRGADDIHLLTNLPEGVDNASNVDALDAIALRTVVIENPRGP